MKYTADNDIVTYEDFLELTEGSEQRHELIDGVVYNMASLHTTTNMRLMNCTAHLQLVQRKTLYTADFST